MGHRQDMARLLLMATHLQDMARLLLAMGLHPALTDTRPRPAMARLTHRMAMVFHLLVMGRWEACLHRDIWVIHMEHCRLHTTEDFLLRQVHLQIEITTEEMVVEIEEEIETEEIGKETEARIEVAACWKVGSRETSSLTTRRRALASSNVRRLAKNTIATSSFTRR
jgi:hypothetical protein